jgi:hypothetical protein
LASTPSFAPRIFAAVLRICASPPAHARANAERPSAARPASTQSSSAKSVLPSTPWHLNRNSSGENGGGASSDSAGSDDTR